MKIRKMYRICYKTYDGVVLGSAHGTREQRRFTFTGNVKLHAGKNRISLLSIAVGLPVSILMLQVFGRNNNSFSFLAVSI